MAVHTLNVLRDQTRDSACRNIAEELLSQFQKQFDIDETRVDLADRLADLGLSGTATERLSKVLQRCFPFLTEYTAGTILMQSVTVEDLVRLIDERVGAR